MASVRQGSIHLFRLAGVEVSLHWSWFLIAVYEIESGRSSYGSIVWSVLEYLALFVIVLTHEFGHAMACRQVGGTADHILLWPFGGVAYVNPPQRPGATLWSIAAGPLVNVALAPLFLGAYWLAQSSGWANTNPDALQLLLRFVEIDLGLLAFNILPIYPLDGGQILRSLLWFVMGKAHSLMVATVVGIIGIAVYTRGYWLGLISVYLLLSCWEVCSRPASSSSRPSCPAAWDMPAPVAKPPRLLALIGGAATASSLLIPLRPRASARTVRHALRRPPASTAVCRARWPRGWQARTRGLVALAPSMAAIPGDDVHSRRSGNPRAVSCVS